MRFIFTKTRTILNHNRKSIKLFNVNAVEIEHAVENEHAVVIEHAVEIEHLNFLKKALAL